MRKLTVFNFISMNGFFKGANEDVSWAHSRPENEYGAEMLKAGDVLLFGRKTYEMMAQFWPTPEAEKTAPAITEGMNKAEKIVFSRTLERADWSNTRVMKHNMTDNIRDLKQSDGPGLTVLGSGSIVNQLADANLIDEFQILMHPIALNQGTSILGDLKNNLELKLVNSRIFESGNVLLVYQPA